MKPQTRTPREADIDPKSVPPTQLFVAFSEERRQHTLAYLAQKSAAIHLGDLAEYIALKEETPTYDRYERILVDLHHQHLPHLCDVGLVRYDAESELLELAVDRGVVAPYVQLAERAK